MSNGGSRRLADPANLLAVVGVAAFCLMLAVGPAAGTVAAVDGGDAESADVVSDVQSLQSDEDPLEPNDSPSSATDVGSGDSYDGLRIDSTDDIDYFAVDAGSGETISADMSFAHADGDLDMILLDEDWNQLAYSYSISDDESVEYTAGDDETYYVAVYGYDGATNEYDIDINTTEAPSGDSLEPNDSPSSATDVGSGDSYDGLNINTPEDIDYFAVEAAASGTVSAEMAFSHDEGDLDLALYDTDENVLDESISISDGESVSADVSEAGTYYVVAYGYAGATNSYDINISAPGTSPNDSPTADATADPSTVGVGETVTLDASGSTDSDGTIESYEWDVDGDGEIDATGAVNDVSYDSPGTYDATVTVTDDDGATDSASVTVTVEDDSNAGPTADATATPSTVGVGETLTLDASGSTDSDGSIESYEWDVDGDGEIEATGAVNDVSYDTAGTYNATVNVTDDNGTTDTATVTVTVERASGVEEGVYEIANVNSGLNLDITGVSQEPGTNLIQWPDNSQANQRFAIEAAGDGEYTLTAQHSDLVLGIDGDGNVVQQTSIDSDVQRWTVTDDGQDGYVIENVANGQALTVDDSSTEERANVGTAEYDGEANQRWTLDRIRDVGDDNSAPTADATADPSTVDVGETLTLDASGSSDSDGEIESYEWDVDGDGETEATGAVNELSYDSSGTYDATVTVTDDDGATDTASVTVTVESDGDRLEPNDNTDSAVSVGDSATFAGLDIDSADDEDYFAVDVGSNENASVDLTFAHAEGDIDVEVLDDNGDRVAVAESVTDDETLETAVDEPGTYYVVVYGYDGATNDYDIYIDTPERQLNEGPSADATADPSTVDVGETLTLDASGSSDSDGEIESYEWDIDGDGEVEATEAVNELSYDSPGTYDATVTVTDDDGATDTASVTVTVEGDGTCDGTGPDADDDGLTDCQEEQLGTDAGDPDTDGDGLPDGPEVNRGDLLPDADPLQYDVYVETDYFGEQVLDDEEQEALENAFDNDEQFQNPGENGIDLHIVVDEEVPVNSGSPLDPDAYGQYQEPEYECAGYHYAAIGPRQDASGGVVGIGGYGSFTVGQDGNQTETYMHELGHSMGLGLNGNGGYAHGGTYSAARYQSVMNYNYFGELRFSDGTESTVAYGDWGFLNEGAYNPGWDGNC